MLFGQLIVGGCLSTTVTLKKQVALLPEESIATMTTLVVPIGKIDPDAGVEINVTPGTLSEIFGRGYLTAIEDCPAGTGRIILSGQIIAGGSVSTTVTVKLQVAITPAGLLTVKVTVVVPMGNSDPDCVE
jgi:hypothetical protein